MSLEPTMSWEEACGEGSPLFIKFGKYPNVDIRITFQVFTHSDDVTVYLSYGDVSFSNFKTKKNVKKPMGVFDMLAVLESEVPKYTFIQASLSELYSLAKGIPSEAPASFMKKAFNFNRGDLAIAKIDVDGSRFFVHLGITPQGHFSLKVDNYPIDDVSASVAIYGALKDGLIDLNSVYYRDLLNFSVECSFRGGEGAEPESSQRLSFEAFLTPESVFTVIEQLGLTEE